MSARRSNQPILREIRPEYSLEELMLKLKLQYFVHMMWRTSSLEKTLMLGKIEGRRRRGWQDELVRRHHGLNGHEFEQTPGDSEGQGSLACFPDSDTTEQLNNNIKKKNSGNENFRVGIEIQWGWKPRPLLHVLRYHPYSLPDCYKVAIAALSVLSALREGEGRENIHHSFFLL